MYRILCIDDDATFLGLYVGFLSGAGYQVVTAQNSKEGFSLLQNEIFDLLIQDGFRPSSYVGDSPEGMKFLRRIRSDNKLKDLPVLIVSGSCTVDRYHPVVDSIAAEFGNGVQGWLKKPFDLKALLNLVASILMDHWKAVPTEDIPSGPSSL